MSQVSVTLVDSFKEAEAFIAWCEQPHPKVAIDTETTGQEWDTKVRTIQLGDEHSGWVIPYERGGWGGLFKDGLSRMRNTTFVMHNFTFDQTALGRDGLALPTHRVRDSRIMAHIVDPSDRTGLKPLADRYIGPTSSQGQKILKDLMAKNKWTWETVPVDTPEYWWYGGLDTVLTARIEQLLEPEVFPRFQRIYDLEYASQIILKRVQDRGVLVDMGYVTSKLKGLRGEIQGLRDRAMAEYGVKNLTSNDQVAAILMEDGWKPEFFTSTGKPSMTKDVLDDLSLQYPLAALCRECKHLEKMGSTQYLGGYGDLVDSDGRVHPSINPIGARTGRMSVTNPALQTLHRDAIVRDAFVPSPGNRMILADYDQMEVRLTAHFAADPDYIDLINRSEDVHRASAAAIYGVTEDAVTKRMRQTTKNAVYSKIYGAGIEKFALTANVSFDEARQFMSSFDRQFPGVSRFTETVLDKAAHRYETEGLAYVMSPAGRRHILSNREVRGVYTDAYTGRRRLDAPAYKLVNYLVQGTGADVLKQAVVDAERQGIDQYLVLLVHDEMGWDVPEQDVADVMAAVKDVMEDRERFLVPLTVGMEHYDRWGSKYR